MIAFVPLIGNVNGHYVGMSDPKSKMFKGDVVCFGYSPNPNEISWEDYTNPGGFMVADTTGMTIQYLVGALGPYHGNKVMTCWKSQKNTKPKEYVPSAWAEPVPLP
jgi:hypothetical protein